MTIYNITALVSMAYLAAFEPNNQSGFKSTENFPFNRNIFPDGCFAPTKTIDRSLPSEDNLRAGSVSQEGEINQVNVSMPCVFPKSISNESDFATYVSSSQMLLFPRADPRINTPRGRKRAKTKILNDTPEKEKLTAQVQTSALWKEQTERKKKERTIENNKEKI